MSYYGYQPETRPTQLADILYQRTVDQLKDLTPFCDACRGATRKDDLVRCIHKTMLTPESLRKMWQRLDDLSKKAVAAAYHNDGEFDADAFVAQYGKLPERKQKSRWMSWLAEPILLDLFIYNGYLPADMMPLLGDLVPPPDRFQLHGAESVPAEFKFADGAAVPLTHAETERAGLHDLAAYLRLVDEGQIKITATSGRATTASLKKITNSLLEGDFFPLPEKIKAADVIRPFGLDVFAQDSGLVKKARGRNELQLTDLGRDYYQTRNPEILLDAFETWTQEGSFDELSRTAVKGQNSRSTRLTEPASRREAIIEALSWCPVDEWISIADFYRAIKIWHFDFDVEKTSFSNLYVGHKDYGELYGGSYWLAVKGLIINIVIWEYLATLGAVDLAYAPPEEITLNIQDYYGYIEYLSLYDGLTYFRINNLGAFLLGQAGEYIPSVVLDRALFVISPDLQVTLLDPDEITPNDQSLLEQVAVPEKEGYYRLDTVKILTAVENGTDLDFLADFLQQRHSGPLPDEFQAWLDEVRRKSRAFKITGQALIISADTPELLELVQSDPVLQKYCSVIGRTRFVIPASREKAFRKRLKKLEYVLQS